MINNRAVDMYEKYMKMSFDEPMPKGRGLLTPMKAMKKKEDNEQPIQVAHRLFKMIADARKELNGKN
jgi:hypothetical protein|tara:strand:- start:256 stop:456 length:201 start_codon:yes stop_codon:yes gene_type:complete